MQWRNSDRCWGIIAIIFHWLTALMVLGLFGLGLWMTNLTYYDSWYQKGPMIHKSIGMLLFCIIFLRILWRGYDPKPAPIPQHKPWERQAATMVHYLIYFLILSIIISGYFMSTTDGHAIKVFNWFSMPALITGIEHLEDTAGWIHYILSLMLMGFVGIHAGAALKHHFFNKDRTLLRMLGNAKEP